MKFKKITKSNGITLPRDIRTQAGLFAGNAVEIRTEGDKVIISPAAPNCFICGNVEDVVPAKEHYVCKKCICELSSLADVKGAGQYGA